MANKILASSLDNFIMVSSSSPVSLPYVTFTVGTIPTDGVVITIKDANDESGYRKDISGSSTSETTINSFNTSGLAIYSLLECLRKNTIFYNITVESSNTLKAMIDTSLKYSIESSNAGISIGGSFSSFSPNLPNKSVVMLQGTINDTSNIVMEKYHNNQTISFNLTAPFQKTTFKKPLEFNVSGYQINSGVATGITIPYNSITVMPTTLTKFQNVNYDDYLYKGNGTVKFLTTQMNRYYNYGEWVGLSILTDVTLSDPRLKKCFYTNSGVFLEEEWTTQMVEVNGKRVDIYDNFELSDIEYVHNKQVGYILVYAYNGMSTQLTEPIRFDVIPHCDGNNEIFFLNEIGGVDSFNFTNTKQVSRGIANKTTYNTNHIRPFIKEYEHQYVNSKRNKITTTVSTNQINAGIADWLNQLVKSKWVYKFLGVVAPMYKMIVVDKFDITTNTNDAEFEVSMEYYDADTEVSI